MLKIEKRNEGVYAFSDEGKSLFLIVYENGILRWRDSLERDPAFFSPILREPVLGKVSVHQEKDGIRLFFEQGAVLVRPGLLISLFNEKGSLLFEEIPLSIRQEGGFQIQGESYAFEKDFRLFDGAHFYGLGDHPGPLDRRNYQYINWNSDYVYAHVETVKSIYKSFPFFLSKKGGDYFGLFLDNPSKTLFDFGVDCQKGFFAGKEGHLDAYFFLGVTPKAVLTSFTALTGRAPLPALWTLGNQQSHWSYKSEAEVCSIVKGFADNDIPLSALHLDIDYMDGFRVFTWNKTNFPNPKALSESLMEQGIHLISIVDPGVKKDPDYEIYSEGVKKDHFAKENGQLFIGTVWPGESVFPAFNEGRTRWWWGENIKKMLDVGISGIWCDMNEPTSFKGEFPSDVTFAGVPHPLIHNVYGHYMAEATYEGIKRMTGKRPFVITRACYVGTCRYSVVWTGDNQAIWDHLRLAIPQQLALGLSGMPLCGTDIGGFCGDSTPELLTRWIEIGLFSPFMRNHSPYYNRPQEPWTFTEECTKTYRKMVKLRYTLLPYLYDLCYEHTLDGLPIMRPLFLEYPLEEEFANCNDEFLWGPSLLVAPILNSGSTERVLKLPKGKWYSYFDDGLFQGSSYQKVPLDSVLLLAKEGAIIPQYPEGKTNLNQPSDVLELHLFDGKGTYLHYQDGGDGFEQEKGVYNLYEFSHDDGALTYRLIHQGYPLYRKIVVIYHGHRQEIEVIKK